MTSDTELPGNYQKGEEDDGMEDSSANVNTTTTAPKSVDGKSDSRTDTYDNVYKNLRPLDAEVAHIISLSDLERKLMNSNQETLTRTKCDLSPKLLNFTLDHILKWYVQCLPKSSSNSSFLASAKKKQSENSNLKNISAVELLKIFTENVECVQNSRELYQPSVLQTVGLCFQDLKEHLKNQANFGIFHLWGWTAEFSFK